MKLMGDITAYSPYYDEYETESWADQDGFQRALVIREDYPSVVWWFIMKPELQNLFKIEDEFQNCLSVTERQEVIMLENGQEYCSLWEVRPHTEDSEGNYYSIYLGLKGPNQPDQINQQIGYGITMNPEELNRNFRGFD